MKKLKSETGTLILVNLAAIMEHADVSLLPGVYKEVGAAFHIDPTGLGSLTLLRAIVQSSCYPLAAYLAINHNRAHLIALGCFLWAAATFMVALSSTFFEQADESLLPGVYKEVGAALHIDPTGLGSLTLFRAIVQSSCYPLAAYLAINHNRAHLIALGSFLWAAATFLVAFSSTFFEVAISRALNGIGLAIVIPTIQSLVADSTDDTNRGTAFGWLQLTGSVGAIIGNLCSVLMASTSFMGIPGWRISFHLVGWFT
ncbi:hypothetical protein NE237_028821 [Protea cynaroides]|uniref:Major facilitator superfamily (MFS) profile domain-containing protein n=1 Tax=Protea cynaroides TaxID=273540 RepID=A0A9Q0GR00_9MAGN|nr:hypothetical protein NE237_028821 [Protea cynaroides]